MKRRMNFDGIKLIRSVVIIIFTCIFFQNNAVAENVTLVWSTFLGGSGDETGMAIAIDSSGAVYVAGKTYATNFPTTTGAFDESHNGGVDAFVTKIEATGSSLIYSTYLGGSNGDEGWAIGLDSTGCAYVTGYTNSANFPTTTGAFDELHNGSSDVFVSKLNADGTGLTYSTFMGESTIDKGYALALDSTGSAYVAGYTESANFPTTAGAYDDSHNGGSDVFVTRLNASGTDLEYSTFLGASDGETGYAIGLDSTGCAYVTGCTNSANFPTTAGAFDESHNGSLDVFVTRLNASGTDVEYSTFLGTSEWDVGHALALDSTGSAYVTGYTASANFPTTAGAFDESYNGGWEDVFITKLNPTGTDLEYSTFLGGSYHEFGRAIGLDSTGCAYVSGYTPSANFPITAGAFDESHNANDDVFVARLNASGTDLEYSTFVGGDGNDYGLALALDSSGCVYVTGETYSIYRPFPATSGAFAEARNFGEDVFVIKLTTDITISGTVTFQYPGWATEHCVRTDYQVRDPGLPPAAPLYEGTLTVCLTPGDAATGSFGIIDDITDGTYDVALKHCNHVADMKTVVISGGKATGVDFTLWAGDADGDNNVSTVEATTPSDPEGDNDVDLSDYYTLYYQYVGGLPVTTGCNADFDGDGNIDLADYYGLYYGYQNNPNPGNWY